MTYTIIKERVAINLYNSSAYRTIYNNNNSCNNYMIADFNTRGYPGSIVAVTSSFQNIDNLLNHYYQNNNYNTDYHDNILFIPNYIVERF